VLGELTLHGQTHPIQLSVIRVGGRFTGATTLRQTDYGLAPISLFGGAVKVKDELRIEFDVAVK